MSLTGGGVPLDNGDPTVIVGYDDRIYITWGARGPAVAVDAAGEVTQQHREPAGERLLYESEANGSAWDLIKDVRMSATARRDIRKLLEVED